MSRKKQPVVRKLSKKSSNARRVVRPLDPATADSRAIRFGSGWAPASLRK